MNKMGTVTVLNTNTTLEVPADRVLEAAIGKVNPVVVIGYDVENDLYLASSDADVREVLWLLEAAKRELFDVAGE
jgi:hypothetical protein